MKDKVHGTDDVHGTKDSAADWLLRLPGVHGVAVGIKEVAGAATGESAILVFTNRKQAASDLAARLRVPTFIDGLPTDVIEMSPVICYGLPLPPDAKPLDQFGVEDNPLAIPDLDSKQYRPLVGGIMVAGDVSSSYQPRGTLTCFLTPQGAPQIGYALTCHHVFFFQATSKSALEIAFQPEASNSTCCAADYSIGTLVDAQADAVLDIGLIALKSGMQWQPEIRDIGPVRGVYSGIPFDPTATEPKEAPRPHLPVKKHGIATGTTGGEVYATGFIGDIPHTDPNTGQKTVFRSNAKGFLVQPRPMAGDWKREVTFATVGDSGAAVLTVADNLLVGILVGGSVRPVVEGEPRKWGVGFVVPIQPVLDRYNGSGIPPGTSALVLATSDKLGDVRTVPGHARVALGQEALIDRKQAAQLEQQVRGSDAGNALADLYWQHAREVRDLVTRNRRVATVWHRSGIANVVRQVLRSYVEPSERLAESYEGKPLAACVREFGRVLSRYGSASLASDVSRFASLIPDMAGLKFAEILERLGAKSPLQGHPG